jgi:hypothetical protein
METYLCIALVVMVILNWNLRIDNLRLMENQRNYLSMLTVPNSKEIDEASKTHKD